MNRLKAACINYIKLQHEAASLLPRPSAISSITLAGAIILLVPCPSQSQQIVREAVSSFPNDTQQLTYANLDQMRSLSNYPQMRQRLFTSQLRSFEDFLRSTGNDPEKDVDEVVLGTRVQDATGGGSLGGIFGVAQGRFQPDEAQQYYARAKLPTSEHNNQRLYGFGSSEERSQLFFTFLSGSLAAFGRLSDLKAMLDARAGTRPTLQSNSAFQVWEAELEGSGPQWGVATGKAAAAQASQFLASGIKLPLDLSLLLSPVQAVLYRFDFGSDVSAQISIVCQNLETAAALERVITAWRDSQRSATSADTPPELFSLLQHLEISASGSRVEVSGSAPLSLIGPPNH